MKFHLLIVDDEVVIRKGLSDYINWDAYDCQAVSYTHLDVYKRQTWC